MELKFTHIYSDKITEALELCKCDDDFFYLLSLCYFFDEENTYDIEIENVNPEIVQKLKELSEDIKHNVDGDDVDEIFTEVAFVVASACGLSNKDVLEACDLL